MPVISIGNSIAELTRCEELKRSLSEYYALAIRTTWEYAVDMEANRTAALRGALQKLETSAGFAASEQDCNAVQTAFRAELRNYRDFSEQYLARLRAEAQATSEALSSFADGITATGTDLEARVKQEIHNLETAAESDDIVALRKGIRTATQGLAQACEQLVLSNRVIVGQLKDELRALHSELKKERRSQSTDPASGALVKGKLEERMERLLEDRQAFWVLLIWCGVTHVQHKHARTSLEEALRALVMRLERSVSGYRFVGRWSENLFAVIVEAAPEGCAEIREAVEKKLSRPFSVQEDGNALPVHFEIRTATVERPTRVDASAFYLQLGQVIGSLEGKLSPRR